MHGRGLPCLANGLAARHSQHIEFMRRIQVLMWRMAQAEVVARERA